MREERIGRGDTESNCVVARGTVRKADAALSMADRESISLTSWSRTEEDWGREMTRQEAAHRLSRRGLFRGRAVSVSLSLVWGLSLPLLLSISPTSSRVPSFVRHIRSTEAEGEGESFTGRGRREAVDAPWKESKA
jgi:hypothetical protein